MLCSKNNETDFKVEHNANELCGKNLKNVYTTVELVS